MSESPKFHHKKEEIGPDQARRMFVFGGLTGLAASLLGLGRPALAKQRPKQPDAIVKKESEFYRKAHPLIEARAGRSKDSSWRSKHPLLDKLRNEETFIPGGILALHNDKNEFVGNGTIVRVLKPKECFILVTAAHVADAGAKNPLNGSQEWQKVRIQESSDDEGADIDMATMIVDERLIDKKTDHFWTIDPEDAQDVGGKDGMLVSIDRDTKPSDLGNQELKKPMFVLSPFTMNRDLLEQAGSPVSLNTFQYFPRLAHFRLVVLPEGTADPTSIEEGQTTKIAPGKGMSGSLVFVEKGSEGKQYLDVGGMLTGCFSATIDGKKVSFGLVLDSKWIKQGLKQAIEQHAQKESEGSPFSPFGRE